MLSRIRFLVIMLFIMSVAAYISATYYTRTTRDYTGPDITLATDSVRVSVDDGPEKILEGITAIDAVDGDVSDTLSVVSMTNFDQERTREVTIAAFDRSGNVTSERLMLSYSDYRAPKLYLTAPLTVAVTYEADVLDIIEMDDCLDGNLEDTVQVYTEEPISSVTGGLYHAHIIASNSAGDTIDLPVTMETVMSRIGLDATNFTLTDYVVYLKKGKTIDPLAYLDSISIYNKKYEWKKLSRTFEHKVVHKDTDVTNTLENDFETIDLKDIDIDNGVDINKDGVYEITYTYEYAEGKSVSVRLVVVVGEE